MNDLDQRLADAFHARAEAVRPEQLSSPAVPGPHVRRLWGPVAVGLVTVAATVTLVVGPGGTDRAADPGPADPPRPAAGTRVAEQPLVALPVGAAASYDDGATGTVVDGVFTVERDGESWSVEVEEPALTALTDLSVDLGARRGYVLRVGPDSDPSPIVAVPGPGHELAIVTWVMATTRIELPNIEHDPGYVGWYTWVGTDGRLYETAYRGRGVDEVVFRWTLPEPLPEPVPGEAAAGDTHELVPRRQPFQQHP